MIKLECELIVEEGGDLNEEAFLDQIVRDSVYGTFGNFPDVISSKLASPDSFSRHYGVEPSDKGFTFTLELSEEPFPLDDGGVSHFVSTLAGELLRSHTPVNKVERVEVKKVFWDAMDQGIQEGNVERVRAAFNLDETEPLLGFSFKPRFGLGESDFFEITKDVLNSGFHIVEPDTRKMLVDSERESYLEFARELPGVTEPSKSAFSLNLSGRTRDIEGIVSSLTRYRDRGWPIVMKIDGGLDGLSLMQRVKKVFPQSIITCYPLLKTILDGKVPKEFMNLALDFCGADVMYPSGRAVIAQEMRNYESEAQENISETYRRYTQFVKRGGFTPTVAGGITPGQLHIFYELYGPDVSFFLGGAVALHTEGPAAGAALCRNIIEHAMNFRVNHPDDDEKIPNVRPSLFNEVRDKFPIGDYQSPSYFFAHNEDIKKHSFAAKN